MLHDIIFYGANILSYSQWMLSLTLFLATLTQAMLGQGSGPIFFGLVALLLPNIHAPEQIMIITLTTIPMSVMILAAFCMGKPSAPTTQDNNANTTNDIMLLCLSALPGLFFGIKIMRWALTHPHGTLFANISILHGCLIMTAIVIILTITCTHNHNSHAAQKQKQPILLYLCTVCSGVCAGFLAILTGVFGVIEVAYGCYARSFFGYQPWNHEEMIKKLQIFFIFIALGQIIFTTLFINIHLILPHLSLYWTPKMIALNLILMAYASYLGKTKNPLLHSPRQAKKWLNNIMLLMAIMILKPMLSLALEPLRNPTQSIIMLTIVAACIVLCYISNSHAKRYNTQIY
jgi:hypothetical protein